MHKNPHQNTGNAIKETPFSKYSGGACPRTPLEVLVPKARVGKFVSVPQKFLSTYAYGSVIQLAGCIYYPHREVEDNWKIQGRGKKLRNVSWKSREGARNVVSNWKSREGGKKCCLEI